ncbi:MAG: amidohydrolase family protein [Eubacteriales bacterium]|nr:amidohydrolase family protein [Eubacteriales bacterium]
MSQKNGEYTKSDLEAARILDDFIPDMVFDAHMHHVPTPSRVYDDDFSLYKNDFRPVFGSRKQYANIIAFPVNGMSDEKGKATELVDLSTEIIRNQLIKHPELVAEVMVAPGDSEEDIEKRIAAAGEDRIIGLKPYHLLSVKKPTFNADICEYLPESAWEVAEKRGLAITLHMVKDLSLSDPVNLSYIKEHAVRYKNVKFILAHCARSFAGWTVFESIDEIANIDNIFFDFAGICESPQMFICIKKAGIERALWGSDWNVSALAGKPISLADRFYWIGEKDLERMSGNTEFNSWLVGTENLMAVRQAAQMLELKAGDVEKLFYRNAKELFSK